jgi:hypothetical protein
MAVKTPTFVGRVKRALAEDLLKAGIAAEVIIEPISGTKLHRITVIAGKFAKLRFTERQAVVWRIIDRVLSRDEQLFISMVVTLTPGEAAGQSAA